MFFLFYCYISCLFNYQKNSLPPLWHLNFFNILFFQHTNNCRSVLINWSAPKPPLFTTLTIDVIESTWELEPNKKLLSVHTPFILHEAMVGVFSLLESHYESNVFIEAIYWNPNAISISLFSSTGWFGFLINLVTSFHLE